MSLFPLFPDLFSHLNYRVREALDKLGLEHVGQIATWVQHLDLLELSAHELATCIEFW